MKETNQIVKNHKLPESNIQKHYYGSSKQNLNVVEPGRGCGGGGARKEQRGRRDGGGGRRGEGREGWEGGGRERF